MEGAWVEVLCGVRPLVQAHGHEVLEDAKEEDVQRPLLVIWDRVAREQTEYNDVCHSSQGVDDSRLDELVINVVLIYF